MNLRSNNDSVTWDRLKNTVIQIDIILQKKELRAKGSSERGWIKNDWLGKIARGRRTNEGFPFIDEEVVFIIQAALAYPAP